MSVIINPKNKTFGQRLASFRKKRGLTQCELAEIIGISQSTLTDYERDKLRLHDDLIVKLTDVLKISANVLLGTNESSGKYDEPSLKIMKRLRRIEKLPSIQQKTILRNIDISLTGIEKELSGQ